MRLKAKFTLIVSIFVITILALIAFFVFLHFKKSIKETISQQQFRMVSILADEIDNKLLSAQQQLIAVADSAPADIMRNPEKAQAFLDSNASAHVIFDNHLFLFVPAGKIFVESPYVPGRRGFDLSFREYLINTLKTKKPYISDPFNSSQPHHHPSVMLTVPLLDGKGKIKGVLTGSIDLVRDNFLERIGTVKIGETGNLYLYQTDGTMIIHPNKKRILVRQPRGRNKLYDAAEDGFEGTGETTTSYGLKVVASFKRLKTKNWILAANSPQTEVYRPIRQAEQYFLSAMIIGVIVVFSTISAIINYLIGPLESFTNHIKNLPQKTGDDRFLDIKTEDEIGTLSRAFNKMVTEIDKRSELERSEDLYRTVTEFSTDFVYWKDTNNKMLYVSENCEKFTDYTEEEFYASPELLETIIHPEDRAIWATHTHDIDNNDNGTCKDLELRIMTKSGQVRWISHSCLPVYDKKGNYRGRRAGNRDITDRKLAEEDLHSVTQRLKLATQSANLGVWDLDPINNILIWDDRMLELYGLTRETFSGGFEAWQNGLHPEDRDKAIEEFQAALRGEKELDTGFRALHPNGTVKHIKANGIVIRDSAGNPIRMIGINFDITEHRNFEHQLRQSQKLEAIGTLAGGIAHDFNNLLQGVFGYISIAKLNAANNDKSIAALEQAEKALHMSVNLTAQLLTFSKGGQPVKKKITLQPVIENSVRFALSGSNADYRIKLDAELWNVEADEGQIGQVIHNIVLNADQAMPMGGTIVIAARNVQASKNGIPQLPEEGKYVEISIQDNGIGISDEYLSKIFDPYFTTKAMGSGLGLATCYSIIKNHGGVIHVLSRMGKGTTFYVYLPAIEAGKEEPKPPQLSPFVRKGKILLMDDEELIRNIARDMIEVLDHEVALAEHGEDAIGKYKAAAESGKPFDIVILDLTIRGGMGGKETIEQLRAVNPGIKAIVSSGYSDDAVVSDYRNYGFSARLTKPYKLEELSDTINKLMNQ